MQNAHKLSNIRIAHKNKHINSLSNRQIDNHNLKTNIQHKSQNYFGVVGYTHSTIPLDTQLDENNDWHQEGDIKNSSHGRSNEPKWHSHRLRSPQRPTPHKKKTSSQLKDLSKCLLTNPNSTPQIHIPKTPQQPIHSRRTNKFKIISGIHKKYRTTLSQTLYPLPSSSSSYQDRQQYLNNVKQMRIGNNGHDININMKSSLSIDNKRVVQVRRETLNDFNQYCFKYISKIQKEASRQIRTAEKEGRKNQVHFKTRNSKRERNEKGGHSSEKHSVEAWRPWSRQNIQQYQDPNTSPFFL